MKTIYIPHPTKVEAIHVVPFYFNHIAEHFLGSVKGTERPSHEQVIEVHDLEGNELQAKVGDWIVKHPTLGLSVVNNEQFKILYYPY